MEITIKTKALEEVEDEALCFFLPEGKIPEGKRVKKLDSILSKASSFLFSSNDFVGKLNQTAVLYPEGKLRSKRILFVGLGKKEKIDLDKLRQASGTLCKKAKELKVKSYSAFLPEIRIKGSSISDFAQAIVEGTSLSNYQLAQYKTTEKEKIFSIKTLNLVDEKKANLKAIKKGAETGEVSADATNLARDMINHPANYMTPTRLANTAIDLSRKYRFKCEVLSLPEIKKLKMGAFLSVAQGSDQPPKFIIMEHKPEAKRVGTVVLVGKGITFDSGGISLKPSENMGEMKADMSGASAVIAVMAACAKLNLFVHLVGLVPATENLPSGTALKPGDIVKSYSGKTIEIISTDAEGRLILADALSYAHKFEPSAIIDIATLTGACVIALGHVGCGMLGNDNRLKEKIRVASQKSGEKVWELPLWEEYDEQIKSDLADMKNTGGRPAGTITAAALLQKFAGDYPWVHLDIAGMDLEEKRKPYIPKGAIGFGVRLLLQFLRNYSNFR